MEPATLMGITHSHDWDGHRVLHSHHDGEIPHDHDVYMRVVHRRTKKYYQSGPETGVDLVTKSHSGTTRDEGSNPSRSTKR